LLNVTASSRASPLPQGFISVLNVGLHTQAALVATHWR
jgi:hypothetical protein